nr:F-box domain, leucine-rich repeat domain, L domain-like protein [Tanacetum cinerariifolium]
EPKRKKAKKDVFTVNLYYDWFFTLCHMIYFQGQCRVLTDTNFDEMTYVHLLKILKRLVPNGFEKIYYCKSGAKLTSIREIKSGQDIMDMFKAVSPALRALALEANELPQYETSSFPSTPKKDRLGHINMPMNDDSFGDKIKWNGVEGDVDSSNMIHIQSSQADADFGISKHKDVKKLATTIGNVLTDTNFDEMTYVHILEILKRLVPNGFEKVYYCKSGAKLTSLREIKSDQDIMDMLKVGYDNGFQIDMYHDHFGYDIMEMVEYDRNEELRKTMLGLKDFLVLLKLLLLVMISIAGEDWRKYSK